jgi:hypothetical protein
MPDMTEEMTLVRHRPKSNCPGGCRSVTAWSQPLLGSGRGVGLAVKSPQPGVQRGRDGCAVGSTITDSSAVRVLALQLEQRKPELREVARQVLQDTNIKTDDDVMEYLESARRPGLGDSDN